MRLILFTLFLIIPLINTAQTKDEITLGEAVNQLSNAMIEGNESVLTKLTAKDLTYGHSSGNLEDQQTYIASVVGGSANYKRIDISDQTIKISQKIGMVRHIMDADVNDITIRLGVLMVWRKEGKQWKLLARQGYKLP